MGTLGRLTVVVDADTGRLSRGMRKGTTEVESFSRRVNKSLKAASSAFVGFMGTAAINTATAFVRKIGEAGEELDRLAKNAARLGVATQELSGLRFAASEFGIEAQQIDKALKTMTVNIGKFVDAGNKGDGFAAALTASGRAGDALERLGLAAEDLAGRSPDKQLQMIADAISRVDDVNIRLSHSAAIFGRTLGPEMVNLLSQGGSALADYTIKANTLQGNFGAKDLAKLEAYNDAMGRLTMSIDGFAKRVAIASPGWTAFIDSLATGAGAIGALIEGSTKVGRERLQFFERLTEGFTKLNTDTAKTFLKSGGVDLDKIERALSYVKGGGFVSDELKEILSDKPSEKSALARAAADAERLAAELEPALKGLKTLEDRMKQLQPRTPIEDAFQAVVKGGNAESIKLAEEYLGKIRQIQAAQERAEAAAEKSRIQSAAARVESDRLRHFGQSLNERFADPEQLFQAQAKKIHAALESGLINRTIASRALEDASRLGRDSIGFDPENRALLKGSESALRALQQAGSTSAAERTAKNTERIAMLLESAVKGKPGEDGLPILPKGGFRGGGRKTSIIDAMPESLVRNGGMFAFPANADVSTSRLDSFEKQFTRETNVRQQLEQGVSAARKYRAMIEESRQRQYDEYQRRIQAIQQDTERREVGGATPNPRLGFFALPAEKISARAEASLLKNIGSGPDPSLFRIPSRVPPTADSSILDRIGSGPSESLFKLPSRREIDPRILDRIGTAPDASLFKLPGRPPSAQESKTEDNTRQAVDLLRDALAVQRDILTELRGLRNSPEDESKTLVADF